MSVLPQIAIAMASIGALLAVMAVVKRMAGRFGWAAEVQRKLVHIATGLYTLTLPWLFPEGWPVYMLVGMSLVVLMVLRLPSVAERGLGSTLHGVGRQSHGDILLILSVGVTFFLSVDERVLYVLPMAVLTLADAAAALAGSAYGKRFFTVEQGRKSVEGTAMFFLITVLVSMCCLLLLTEVPRQNVIALAFAVAAIGTLIEAESWRGLDNFFLPVGLMLYLNANLDVSLAGLALELAGLGAVIALFHSLGQRLAIGPHTVRVYVIVGFLIVTVAEIQNTVLPMVALVAHALASRRVPCAAAYPHLDIATVLIFVSVGWLALGNATGFNALQFYQSTFAALAMACITLSTAGLGPAGRIPALAVSGGALLVITVWLTRLNPAPLLWSGTEWIVATASIGVAIVVPPAIAGHLRRRRAAKVAILALSVPLLAYLYLVSIHAGGGHG